jgi:hypothetical protein
VVPKGSIGLWFSHAAVIATAVGLIYSCSTGEPPAQKTAAVKNASVADSIKTIQPKENRHIVVYYFHGNARCPTCFKLETIAKSEIEADFGDAIKAGTLEWKTVNVEEKGNEHFNEDYKLYTKSVIISIQQDGKEASWKNLEKIWQLVHEEPAYRAYIKNEVKACLEGICL